MSKHTKYIFAFCLSIAVFHAANAADEWPMWYPVQVADVIAYGKLTIKPESSDENSKKSSTMIFHVDRILKGTVDSSALRVTYQSYQKKDASFGSMLNKLVGKRSIVLLKHIPNSDAYLIPSEFGPASAFIASNEMIAKVSNLIGHEEFSQRRLSGFIRSQALDAKVTSSIDKLSSLFSFRRDDGRDNLLKMGCVAAPFIIMHMRDFRPYHGYLKLYNLGASSSEAYRVYKPKVVYDALSAILTQITGLSFESVENGASDEIRNKDYLGWLSYMSYELGNYGDDDSVFMCKASK